MKAPLYGLYAITDSHLMPCDTLLRSVEAALRGGARVIQYRDKSDDGCRRLQEAKALVDLCERYHCPLLINDDTELARASGAHGVHLGQEDGCVADARRRLGSEAIIGVTCHARLDLAQAAAAEGADYVAFGAFFPSATKPGAPPAPLALLTQAREALQLPVVAIGGLSVDNANQVIDAGADMVAVIHSLFAAPNIEQRAREFSRLFAAQPDGLRPPSP